MSLYPKAGMIGYPALVTDENPESWLPVIHELYPNGDMPLAGLFLSLGKEKADSDTFNWWERDYQTQTGDITNVYTNVSLDSAYTSGGSSGDIVYVKMSANDAKTYGKNDVVQFISEDDYRIRTRGLVEGYHVNGASSYVIVRLVQDDPTYTTPTGTIADADKLLITGHAQPQGSTAAEAKAYSAYKRYNVTQILTQTLSISRTLMQTTVLRTGNKYEDLKLKALELLMQKLERSLITGYRYESTGDNGQPQNISGGIEYFLEQYASDNIVSFNKSSDAQWKGYDWIEAGKDFLDTQIEQIFRKGASQTRMAVCGSGALKGLADLAHAYGEYRLESGFNQFGLAVTEFVTANGTIQLKKHPLWQDNERDRHRILIVPTENINARVIDDIQFHEDGDFQKGGLEKFDGKKEWFLTELGWQIMHPETFGDLHGIGKDNSVT